MCLRYNIIHIVLRSFVIQIGYLRYFFITLNAFDNSEQCYVLECQKKSVSLIYLECEYLVLVNHSLKTFQNILSQTFCKEHNIKKVFPLVSIKNTKQNLGILNVKSVNCI